MADGNDGHKVIDSIHDAKVAPAGAVQAFELIPQGLTDSSWILSERAVDELRGGDRHLRRKPGQGTLGGRRPGDRMSHRFNP